MILDLDVIAARLRAQVPALKSVGGAADLDAAIEGAVTTPSAFVIPMAYDAEKPYLVGVHAQDTTEAFAVLLVTSNKRDGTGAAALQDLRPLREQVRAALAGWAPDPATGEPVSMTGGRLLAFPAGRLWWADEFQVQTSYRSN